MSSNMPYCYRIRASSAAFTSCSLDIGSFSFFHKTNISDFNMSKI